MKQEANILLKGLGAGNSKRKKGSTPQMKIKTPAPIVLTIPDVPPSPNRVLGRHWSTKAGEKNKWILWIRSQAMPGGSGPRPFKMRVKITLCQFQPLDPDNSYGAVKPVLDALKHWGLIWDDAPRWLELKVEQEKCPHKKRHTIIELEVA